VTGQRWRERETYLSTPRLDDRNSLIPRFDHGTPGRALLAAPIVDQWLI
jgi:hypothetical protein